LNTEEYDFVNPFSMGQALVSKNCRSYFVNKAGKPVAQTNDIGYHTEYASGVRIVTNKQQQMALMDSTGKLLTGWVTSFATKDGHTSSYQIYEKGNHPMASSITTQLLPAFTKGYIQFENEGKRGLVDSTGRILLNAEYDIIMQSGKRIVLSKTIAGSKKYGLTDYSGKQVLPMVYADIQYHYQATVNDIVEGVYYLYKDEDGLPVILEDK
jgi:hypothetical protein